jgi:hypothetical protein
MMQLRLVPLNALRRQQERREESIEVRKLSGIFRYGSASPAQKWKLPATSTPHSSRCASARDYMGS